MARERKKCVQQSIDTAENDHQDDYSTSPQPSAPSYPNAFPPYTTFSAPLYNCNNNGNETILSLCPDLKTEWGNEYNSTQNTYKPAGPTANLESEYAAPNDIAKGLCNGYYTPKVRLKCIEFVLTKIKKIKLRLRILTRFTVQQLQTTLTLVKTTRQALEQELQTTLANTTLSKQEQQKDIERVYLEIRQKEVKIKYLQKIIDSKQARQNASTPTNVDINRNSNPYPAQPCLKKPTTESSAPSDSPNDSPPPYNFCNQNNANKCNIYPDLSGNPHWLVKEIN